ncbi:MAG: hypothetical protein M3680_31365 [Myxococcota bacterium]|nr:hypothetical protein [Myxococcota bacterium]
MKRFLNVVLVSSLALVGCKKQSESADRPEVTKPIEAAAQPPTAPAEPTPAELVTALAACTDYVSCSKVEAGLAKAGVTIAPDLVKIAVDGAKPRDARETAAKGLVAIKAPGTGMALFEAAKADADIMIRGPLYAAAAASGDAAVFEAAKAHLMTEAGWDDRIQVNKALVPFGKQTFDWAAASIVKTKKFSEVSRFGELIGATATAAELPALEALLPQVKEQMARGDLAQAMIELGSPQGFDVLMAGLQSKDDLERNNAAKTLESVVDKLPAERKAEFAAAVEYGKANDRSGTYTNWDAILGKLK